MKKTRPVGTPGRPRIGVDELVFDSRELAVLAVERRDYLRAFAECRGIKWSAAKARRDTCVDRGLLRASTTLGGAFDGFPTLELGPRSCVQFRSEEQDLLARRVLENAWRRLPTEQQRWATKAHRLFCTMNDRIARAFEAGDVERGVRLSRRMARLAERIASRG